MPGRERSEAAEVFAFNSWRDLTPMHVSKGSMLHNKTGTWRFIKPVYEDKTPACQNGCPAGNDIEAWIKLIQAGDFEGAARLIRREQPFPSILGRICFKFCQERCNRGSFDHHVQINELERFVGDQVANGRFQHELPPYHGKSLAVVGSGPAGMACAYFARLLGFRITMFEKEREPGGILRTGIPSYRLPKQIVTDTFEDLESMGIELITGTAVGRDISLAQICADYDYLFLATGVHDSIKLGLEGEEKSPQVMSGLEFLKRVALGQSVTLGEQVVVVGGGNTAIDTARTAARLGVDVTVVYRRSEREMPAHPEEVEEARREGVRFIFLAAPDRLEFNPDGSLAKLVCCEMQLAEADQSGRRRPVRREGSQFCLAADTLFSAIGEKADLAYLEGLCPQARGPLAVKENLRAQVESGRARVFAGGDIIDIPHSAAHAVAAGKQAAIAMDCDRNDTDFSLMRKKITIGTGPALSFSKYIGWQPLNPGRHDFAKVVTADKMVFDYFQKTDPEEPERLGAQKRKHLFDAYQTTFTPEQAQREARRCMHCGRCTACDNCLVFCPDLSVLVKGNGSAAYVFDYNYCKGCGICASECPRNAITMLNEQTPISAQEA